MVPFVRNREENAFFKLGKNNDIVDRKRELQEGIRVISVRDKSDEIIKKAADHLISLLHKFGRPAATPGLPPNELPPAEIVFKDLLQSKTSNRSHPNQISSLAYSFASLVNLSIRRHNSNQNDVSAYFDLYPLYGGQSSDFNKVRLKESGMLSPDCFFDNRLILLPRASAVLLILFNRNHNYIARRLLLQRESDQSLSQQDDEIFEMARRINCGHFRNIMLEDVLKPLMGLSTVGPSHKLNLLSETKSAQLGKGFDSYIESALLYDWSTFMSGEDIRQFEKVMPDIVNHDPDTVSPSSFEMNDFTSTLNANKRNQNWAGLLRGEDGRFRDQDLAKILYDATECPVGQGIPSCQRIMQIKAIEWARNSKACSLNDYRKFLGLKALQSFKEWTSNETLAASAEKLYKSIDNLEVYVGLQVEEPITDSGFQFGYTKTYGLLVDIISRIRSDPALTTDFTAENLTLWGYNDCGPRSDNGCFGAWIPKLLQRTLPREYAYNNIYGLFPLSVPENTPLLLKSDISEYDTNRPQWRKVHSLVTMKAIGHVSNDPNSFPTVYSDNLIPLTGEYGYFIGFDDEKRHDQDQKMSLHALIPDQGALRRYAQSFANMARECVEEIATSGSQPVEIDVARDVINAVCIRWVCETLLDYPLKRAGKITRFGKDEISGSLMPYIWRMLWLIWSVLWYFFSKVGALVMQYIQPKLRRWITFVTGERRADYIWNILCPQFSKIGGVSRQIQFRLLSWIKVLTEEETNHEQDGADVHAKFAALYAFVFHNNHSEDTWELRRMARRTSAILASHIRSKLPLPSGISRQAFLMDLSDSLGDIGSSVLQIMKEYTTGKSLPEQTAQTFLDRVVNANQSIPPLPPYKLEPDNARVIANVLGLAVVAAVKYAKVCTQAVNFYLQDEYIEQRNEIIRLSELNDAKSKMLLTGYIREAYRLDHPPGIWRNVSNHNVIPQGPGLPDIVVDAGDSIYVDFRKAFINPLDFADPSKVDPTRQMQGIQGLGLHKCSGISFVDHTMPEIFKAIFKLQSIRRAPGRSGRLVRFTHPYLQDTDPMSFVDAKGGLGPYPTSLVLHYDHQRETATNSIAQKREKSWRIVPGKANANMRTIIDRTISVLVIVWIIYSVTISVISLFSSSPSSHPASQSTSSLTPSPSPSTPPSACLPPTTSIQPWEITTMEAGDDGKLIPLEYTLDHPTAHSLSIVDVDAKDMTMTIWLDNMLLGATYDVELNKSENCGDNFGECLNKGFSGGYIVVPKGKHTVRIQWAGVELPGPDGKIDWGEERGRRLGWSKDSCAA